MKKQAKLISLALAVLMLASMLPTVVFATEGTPADYATAKAGDLLWSATFDTANILDTNSTSNAVSADGSSITLDGNTWYADPVDGLPLDATVTYEITFDVRRSSASISHGFAIDKNNNTRVGNNFYCRKNNVEYMVGGDSVPGYAAVTWDSAVGEDIADFDGSTVESYKLVVDGANKAMSIYVLHNGSYFKAETATVAFKNDVLHLGLRTYGTGTVTFSNVKIYKGSPVEKNSADVLWAGALDDTYIISTDSTSAYSVADDGSSLTMGGNTWYSQRLNGLPLDDSSVYTIAYEAVRSNGSICHGIGVDLNSATRLGNNFYCRPANVAFMNGGSNASGYGNVSWDSIIGQDVPDFGNSVTESYRLVIDCPNKTLTLYVLYNGVYYEAEKAENVTFKSTALMLGFRTYNSGEVTISNVRVLNGDRGSDPFTHYGYQVSLTDNRVRFLSAIEALDYTDVGFAYSVSYNGGVAVEGKTSVDTVYTAITETIDGESKQTTAKELGGTYIYSVIFDNIPTEGTLVITVTPIANDGTIKGKSYTLTEEDLSATESVRNLYDRTAEGDVLYEVDFRGDSIYNPELTYSYHLSWGEDVLKSVSEDGKTLSMKGYSFVSAPVDGCPLDNEHSYTITYTAEFSDKYYVYQGLYIDTNEEYVYGSTSGTIGYNGFRTVYNSYAFAQDGKNYTLNGSAYLTYAASEIAPYATVGTPQIYGGQEYTCVQHQFKLVVNGPANTLEYYVLSNNEDATADPVWARLYSIKLDEVGSSFKSDTLHLAFQSYYAYNSLWVNYSDVTVYKGIVD